MEDGCHYVDGSQTDFNGLLMPNVRCCSICVTSRFLNFGLISMILIEYACYMRHLVVCLQNEV